MPTFYKGGNEPKNKGKLTNKAYFIKRLGNKLYRRWGAVDYTGHSIKKMIWCDGYPQSKVDTYKTEEDAKEALRVLILRRLSNGYHKIVDVIK